MYGQIRKGLAILALLAGGWCSGGAWALPYSSMVVFGDSLADSGNNALALGGAQTPVPLAGPLIPTDPYASGRYSNGPVWTEYLAGRLGLSANPSLAGGSNFAFGGARTGTAGAGQPPGLSDQLGMYLLGAQGVASTSALYVIEGGGNDARDVMAAVLMGMDPTALISAYASNVSKMIGTLHAAGAEHFLVWNTPDIGLTPFFRSLGPVAAGAGSYYSGLMNAALAQALALLSPDVTDDLRLFDAYGALNQIVAAPNARGFANVTDACGATQGCYNDPSVAGSYLFWDGIHPTTAAHAEMARLAQSALPEPGSILLVLMAGLALFAARRRAA